MADKKMVKEMFDDISPRYDLLNHLLSFGTDRLWRKKFVKILRESHPRTILDVATGTADLAIAMTSLDPEKITGIDIATGMLEVGRRKIDDKKLQDLIVLLEGDAENIPFPENSFDAVTVCFGVRNYENLEKGLAEMRRILRPGGVMQILEFSRPGSPVFRALYKFYSAVFIPVAGKLISGNSHAYSYLPESIAAFPSGDDFLSIMEKTGMHQIRRFPLTFGIATIYSGRKI